MYVNLRYELMVKRISQRCMADKLGIGPNTMSEKMTRKKDFKLQECLKIKKILNTDLPVEELFKWKDVEHEVLS